MEENTFERTMMKYLSKELDADEVKEFENVLKVSPEYQKRFDALHGTWTDVANMNLPNPSTEMHERFYEMLQTEIGNNNSKDKNFFKNLEDWVRSFFLEQWKPQLAYSIGLLSIGLLCGHYLNTNKEAGDFMVEQTEVETIREKFVLTLLDQPSVHKRLQAVNESAKMVEVSASVVDALFMTLNNDPNTNVRLAAVESLEGYAEDPEVRLGLVKSITGQESPLIQIALADLMVELQERGAIDPMKQLMKKSTTDKSVKQKLQESISAIM
ncbi:HEAT repeat domain-containing protein [Flagellimonas sp. CMM7]|uniref:HEAT repeat domain-containing protein n=1 Tax=Flagellimonas sp. CMM7 TaxID=2654676 RepID=UPI0013D4F45F|nr:HEAT repeat domain-containing protein [Flagellimonas sp. CMM7]UII80083.1 HEAT repeat domain-containing protein [Flagellimonas sp. CMM7]